MIASQSGAEFGRGAAGTMALHARTGSDKYQYSFTNVFPGFDIGNGVRVGSFTPRGNFSGPWIKGRAWFFNTTELQYNDTIVPQLPAGGNSTHSWRFSDIIHNQVNLTPKNNLFVGLLFNYFNSPPAMDSPISRSHRDYGKPALQSMVRLCKGSTFVFTRLSDRVWICGQPDL